jgi:hypothetical protein
VTGHAIPSPRWFLGSFALLEVAVSDGRVTMSIEEEESLRHHLTVYEQAWFESDTEWNRRIEAVDDATGDETHTLR